MTELFHRRQNLIICLCLAVVTAAVYWPVRHFEFVNYDDNVYVYETPMVQSGLTLRGLVWAFTTNRASNWHPFIWLSHMLDCQLFGMNAGAHHLVNVLLHVVNTLLLFGVLKRMTAASWRSAFVAALFALHPLHVESVAWVAERKDVLSTCFWMLAMWAYVRYVEQPNAARYWLTLGFYALGLMAKPMVVTLPFVLLLLDYWPLGRTQWAESVIGDNGKAPLSRLLWEKLPFLALAAASCVTTVWAQHAGGVVASLASLPIRVRVPNAIVSYLRYVEKMFWPTGLAVFYPFRMRSLVAVTGASLVLLGVTVAVVWRARREPYLIMGWLWYLGTLVPVIGFVQVGGQSMADRYTYIPLVGLFMMVSWGVPCGVVEQPVRRVVVAVTAVAMLVACAVSSWFQVGHWRNSETLFRHALNVTRDNWLARNNLGVALANRGHVAEAIAEYAAALRIKPDYAWAHNNLGVVLAQTGRLQESIRQFYLALRIEPDYAEAHYNLGKALFDLGKVPEAIKQYEQALWIKPDYADAHYNLANILLDLGKVPEAIKQYEQVLHIEPNSAETHYNLGDALYQLGKVPMAIARYRGALRLKPDWPPALSKLAWILATDRNVNSRNAGEAVQLAERFCAVTGYQDAKALDVLAAAYAEAGRFSDAIRVAQKAIELAGAAGQQELAQKVRERLKLYQAGRSFHERPAAQTPPA